MESLLSLSFTNISSRDTTKIRKGLRQIEGLLAQLCLDRKPGGKGEEDEGDAQDGEAEDSRQGHKGNNAKVQSKDLDSLSLDPAFREFSRLQDGFEWNGK